MSPRFLGQEGVELIKQFEGCARKRPDGMIEAYPDPGTGCDPWTIGWGATGPGIRKGVVWTKQQCDARFDEDIKRYAADVARALQVAAADASRLLLISDGGESLGSALLALPDVLDFLAHELTRLRGWRLPLALRLTDLLRGRREEQSAGMTVHERVDRIQVDLDLLPRLVGGAEGPFLGIDVRGHEHSGNSGLEEPRQVRLALLAEPDEPALEAHAAALFERSNCKLVVITRATEGSVTIPRWTLRPIAKLGWASACSGVTSWSSSRVRPRKGPPLAVSQREHYRQPG